MKPNRKIMEEFVQENQKLDEEIKISRLVDYYGQKYENKLIDKEKES